MNGIELITEERKRQIEKEGWSESHDAEHSDMSLAVAGASYALHAASAHTGEHFSWGDIFRECALKVWPFDREWFKPTPEDPIRQLVKAGALIAAEIDRIQNQ